MKTLITRNSVLLVILCVLGGFLFITPGRAQEENGNKNSKKEVQPGTELWATKTGNDGVFSAAAVSGNRVFVGGEDGTVFALNLKNGNVIWKTQIGNRIRASVTVHGSRLFAANYRGDLYCLSSRDGDEIWKFPTGSSIQGTPAVYKRKVYFGNSQGSLYCLKETSGEKIWKAKAFDDIDEPVVIGKGRVYCGDDDKNVFAFDAETGNKIWSIQVSDNIYAAPAYKKGKLYVGCSDGQLYCLNVENGETHWNRRVTNSYIRCAPIVARNRVIVGNGRGKIVCSSVEDGNEEWSIDVGKRLYGSPIVLANRIYLGTTSGLVYSLNLSNGEEIWSYSAQGNVYSTPVAVDGKLYVGTYKGKMYCLKTKSFDQTVSWPLQRQNLKNTGSVMTPPLSSELKKKSQQIWKKLKEGNVEEARKLLNDISEEDRKHTQFRLVQAIFNVKKNLENGGIKDILPYTEEIQGILLNFTPEVFEQKQKEIIGLFSSNEELMGWFRQQAEKLDAREYHVRETATQNLRGGLPLSRLVLEEYRDSNNLEVRARVKAILE